jgi:DNA-binding transcriptional ArsR family regulator
VEDGLMVLSSTLRTVKAALDTDPQSIGKIAEKADLTIGAVRYSLGVLMELGVVERVNGISPSEKKGGWIRAQYRLQPK